MLIKKKIFKKTKSILIILFNVFLIFFILERISIYNLKKLKIPIEKNSLLIFKKKNLINNLNEKRGGGWKNTVLVSGLDPLLGYSHNESEIKKLNLNYSDGYFIFKKYFPNKKKISILVYGGSTTDSITSIFNNYKDKKSPYSWPEELSKILTKKKISHIIYNGGTVGYTSSQNLIKFIRDYKKINPDIVISLSGLNDIEDLHNFSDNKLYGKYHVNTYKYLIKPSANLILPNFYNFMVYLKIINKNSLHLNLPKNKTKDYEQWSNNTKMMNDIISNDGKKYYLFLQGGMGTDYEIQSSYSKLKFFKNNKKYLENLKSFYVNAKILCKKSNYCIDQSNLFHKKEFMFSDPRHQNYIGVKFLAKEIYEKINLVK